MEIQQVNRDFVADETCSPPRSDQAPVSSGIRAISKPAPLNAPRLEHPRQPRVRLSIAHKLGLLIGGLQLAIVVFLAVFFQYTQLTTLRSNLRAKAATYGQLVSAQVRSAVAFDDQETAREVFESIATDPELLSAALYKNARELRSWGTPGPLSQKAAQGVNTPQVFELADRFLAVTPVVSLEGPRGTLALEFSKQQLERSAAATRSKALVIGGAALGLGLLLAVLIARSFAGRLRAIAVVAERVAAGDLEQQPVRDPRPDEIGSLAASFNAMLTRLKALIAEIRSSAEEEQQRLEGLVQHRTNELETRNDDMRRVLENVDQGFLTIGRDGQMSSERSRIIATWLGPAPASGIFWDYLDTVSPGLKPYLELGWGEVIQGDMPLEVTLSQMPRRLEADGRHFSVDYKPVLDQDGHFERTLVVLSDITAVIERGRVERDEQEILQLFSRLLSDRAALMEFFSESNDLVEDVVRGRSKDMVTARRKIHTLKGNSALFGLDSIAVICHELEESIAESGEILPRDTQHLLQRWQRISGKLSSLLGDGSHPTIKIDDDDYHLILKAIANGTPRGDIRSMVEAWRLEATVVRLNRVAEQAQALAGRLGKSPLEVRVESNRLRLEPSQWTAFWAAVPHLLRNAIDHGVETPEERALAGKTEPARLRLKTWLTADNLVFEVEDNGRGIDWDAVREAARKKGLPHATAADLETALFSDGLTTRTMVSETSGRGVGMGALRQAVEALSGHCEIRSRKGEGTSVRMVWPASLATGPLSPPASERRFSIAVGLKWANQGMETGKA